MTPATDWKEIITEGEAARFERYAEELRDMARRRAASGKASRALHAKGLGGFEAEFTVLPDLPEHARVSLFAGPATYRAYVRFSNGSGAHQPDKKPDVRGVAIKVLGVEGKKIIPGLEDKKTVDFLLIRSAATPFRDADEFVGLVRATESPLLLLPRMLMTFGLCRTFQLLGKLSKGLGEPVCSFAATRYFSALPIKLGPHAVHYELSPQLGDTSVVKPTSPDYLAEELAGRLRQAPVAYDFRVQFYCDATRTPIEDASVEWKEADAPFITIARLVIPQQDAASARGRRVSELCEALSFDPWHKTEELRPLGNMMRARNHAYRVSTQERGAAPEPDGPLD